MTVRLSPGLAAAAGSVLAAAGSVLLYLAWSAPDAQEELALWDHVQAGVVDPEASGIRGLPADVALERWELRLPDRDRPLAEMTTAELNGRRVVVSFRSLLAQPIERVDVDPAALAEAARAIREHAPEDAVILGWWDTSRALALLSDREARFGRALAKPLLVPDPWRDREHELAARARAFLGEAGNDEDPDFDRFVEALLAPPETGLEILRELAGGEPAILVLDLRDVYKLAALAPERFPWGYRDFPAAERSHGLIRQVKDWLRENGYAAYAVEPRPESGVRVHWLGEAATRTLAAKLLPFDTAEPLSFPDLPLVFQHGTYWLWRVGGEGPDVAGQS